VPEPGQYLIHITLVPDPNDTSKQHVQGERLDVHMGFKAGTGEPTSKGSMTIYGIVAFAALYGLYLSSAGFKKFVDGLFGKIKD
jgi:hypothetical protein